RARHQFSVGLISRVRLVELSVACGEIDAPQIEHGFLQCNAGEIALLLAAGDAGVVAIRNSSVSSRNSPPTVSTARLMTGALCAGMAVSSTLAKSLISLSTAATPSRS